VCALQGSRAEELTELRARAAEIRSRLSAEEITAEQARRRVQLLVNSFTAWSEAHDVELELRARTFTSTSPTTEVDDPLTVNRCSLFYDDDSDELCLIDLKRTEIWGTKVLFCRYLCE